MEIKETPDRKVLVVDDQYGNSENPMFPERYEGRVPGYTFLLEDAVEKHEKKPSQWDEGKLVDTPIFSSEKVLKRIRDEGNIVAILLDMDFGYDQKGYGLEIADALLQTFPEIPVFYFSSSKDYMDEARGYGVKIEWDHKLPSNNRLKEILDSHT